MHVQIQAQARSGLVWQQEAGRRGHHGAPHAREGCAEQRALSGSFPPQGETVSNAKPRIELGLANHHKLT